MKLGGGRNCLRYSHGLLQQRTTKAKVHQKRKMQRILNPNGIPIHCTVQTRNFNPKIPNPGILAVCTNPKSRDWRHPNPGISG